MDQVFLNFFLKSLSKVREHIYVYLIFDCTSIKLCSTTHELHIMAMHVAPEPKYPTNLTVVFSKSNPTHDNYSLLPASADMVWHASP